MRIFARPHQLPPRLAAGVFFLHSGLGKIDADPQTAAFLHGTAAKAYPFLRRLAPETFTRVLSRCEVALGMALLTPVVPSLLAGAGLAGFSAGLVGLYLRTPGLRREGSLRPTDQGLSMAKDVWLLGIGLGLVAEELAHR
ncbi:hypothetical protein ABGB18_29785 [Nonomuraea sp. B12E4]|uniref:hypothetical protein n=1 Tax=Nonomuraea sp. B12E4 TaxID=3153564 RepID=UPI00325DB813